MRIGLIVPPGFAVLSFAPLSVFEAANGVVGKPFYEIHAVSVTGGRIPNSFGMEMQTVRVADGTFDTLLVGSPPELRPQSPELLSFLRSAPATTRRIASICIGAFILGEAGLLDGEGDRGDGPHLHRRRSDLDVGGNDRWHRPGLRSHRARYRA